MSQSNGGISSNSRISAYPMTNVATGVAGLYAFDPTVGYNDVNNPSNYFYKVEQIVPGKTPTVNNLIITYRDLGIVLVTFNLTATNDLDKVVSATTGPIQLGNSPATGRIITRNTIGLTLTGQNFQLSFTRAAGAGQLAIVSVIMRGTVEFR